MSLLNKVAIITGASSGIGAGIAEIFAKEGANVVIVGRNADKLKDVAAKCEKYGKNPLVLKIDVSKEEEAKNIVKETIAKFKKIDILVNNAGIVRFGSILSENILQVFDEVMNTNLRAMVQVTNLAAPHLIESKGNIINISSIGSKKLPESPQFISYCVSKAAVDHLTRCVAAELGLKGVRVNVINPGPVKTDIAENSGMPGPASDQFWEKMKAGTLLNRVSDVEEIAELALFLASDKARGITGSSFVSDNGMTINNLRK